MPEFIPVDHDPFAQPQQPQLVPVDYNPFAPSTPPAVNPRVPEFAMSAEGQAPAPQPENSYARGLKMGVQDAGRGLGNFAGMPVDLATGALNTGITLARKGSRLLGGEGDIPYIEKPFMGSDFIREKVGNAYEAAGGKLYDDSERSAKERLTGNIIDFGTQAAATGGAALPFAASRQVAIQTGKAAPAIADAFLRPYFDNPGSTLTGDVASGVGAGTANSAIDNAPDWLKPYVDNPFVRAVATLFGGGAGAATKEVGAAAGRTVGGLGERIFTPNDPKIPIDPTTNMPVKRGEAETAARMMQDVSRNPQTAAMNIRDNADAMKAANLPQPSIGLVSGDIGLQSAETAARTKNGIPFIENDNRLRTAATDRVNSLKDPGADQTQPRSVAQTEAALRTNAVRQETNAAVRGAERDAADLTNIARQDVAAARQAATQADESQRQFGAPIAARANSDAKANASRQLDAAVVDQGYIPARTEKNRQFDTAPGRNEQLPADEVLSAVDDVVARNNALRPDQQLPSDLISRLEKLRPVIDPETGENVGGPGVARGGDLADTRKFLSTAYDQAQRAGNFDLADSIATLRGAINRTIEGAPGYAEANANYRQFADTYRPTPNDEGAKFTREIDRDPGRGATPPTETAGRFLAGPEKADALNRMLQRSPNGEGAVRDYLRSDFGMAAVNPDGTLNANRAAAWARNNADVLSRFPGIRQEFDDMVATAKRGGQLSADARANLERAQRGLSETEQDAQRTVRGVEREGERKLRATEADIERSAVGTLLNEDPRDTARRIFGSQKYSAEKELDEINKVIGGDAQARRGWRAAVAEAISDQVSGTAKMDSGKAGASPEFRVELSKVDKLFKDNEGLLTKVFTPEEMSRLRQGHAVLEPLKNASVRATAGSNTADKSAQMWRLAEAGLKAKFGVLKGGGYLRTLRVLAATLPDDSSAVQRVIERAWFDPDIAEYLLTKKVRNLDGDASNAYVRRLMAGAAAGRASGEPDQGQN